MTFLAQLTGGKSHRIPPMDSPLLMIILIRVFPLTHGSLHYQFKVPTGFPPERETIQQSLKEKKISSFVFKTTAHAVFIWLLPSLNIYLQRWYWVCFCPHRVLQVSVRPQKTSQTRSRTCGPSAAQISAGRTPWPVLMARSRVMVGQLYFSPVSFNCVVKSTLGRSF